MTKVALITGITGQDGSYLAERLLAEGYAVHGLIRETGSPRMGRIAHLQSQLSLHPGNFLSQRSLTSILEKVQPTEVYNLAASSFVPTSWADPVLALEETAVSVVRLLEAIRLTAPKTIRFYQASSSEMFGGVNVSPQNESTPLTPRNPYGAAKIYAHQMTVNYRERYGMFCVSGIAFNHESPRRGEEFVTRKISQGVARIKRGLADSLTLGDIDARRDWGFAGDYATAMWLSLRQAIARDYVIGTGRPRSVRQFVELAFEHVGLKSESHVKIDPALLRPREETLLVADPSRAKEHLGWTPTVSFEKLVAMMVDADLAELDSARAK